MEIKNIRSGMRLTNCANYRDFVRGRTRTRWKARIARPQDRATWPRWVKRTPENSGSMSSGKNSHAGRNA